MNREPIHTRPPWPPTGAPDGAQRPTLSLAEAAAMVVRRWLLIVCCMLLVSVAAVALYMIEPPIYSSTARVLIQTDQLGTPSFLSGIAAYRESQVAEPVNRKIETEMALILSRSNATKVIQSLGIGPGDLPASPLKIIIRSIGDLYREYIDKPDPASEQGSSAKLVDDFLAGISIEAVRSKTAETTSNVLEIKVDSARDGLAPRALTALLQAYLEVGAQQAQRLGQATVARLNEQVMQAKGEFSQAEQAILALSIQESSRVDIAAAATSAAAIQGGGKRDAAGGANEAVVSQLATQMMQLQAQLADLRESFTDETESVRKLKQRVADARSRLAAHMRASATSSGEFSRLESQRVLAQDHYAELRRKLEQIDLYMQLTPAALNGRVVVDAPSTPTELDVRKRKLLLFVGPAAGLLLGLLMASLKEVFMPRLRTRRDVERLLGVPLLGAIPTMPASRVQESKAAVIHSISERSSA